VSISSVSPIVDQPRRTRDDPGVSGLQVNTLTVAEHQALLQRTGQRPLSLAEISSIHGEEAATREAARRQRAAAARSREAAAARTPAEVAVRWLVVGGERWRVTVECDPRDD
jgi:hypothetical protein